MTTETWNGGSPALEAVEELRRRANAMRMQLGAEEPKLIAGLESFFEAPMRWYFKELRARKLRPWAAYCGPDREMFTVAFAADWWKTLLVFARETALRDGGCVFDAAAHVGDDLWPKSLYQVPTIGISEDFDLSARALHRIGLKAREALPAGARLPPAAKRRLELLGLEVLDAGNANAP